MKKKLIAGMVALVLQGTMHAQRSPLNGSGKLVQRNFELTNFDKIVLTDLAGKTAIEVGRPFSISIVIDDNLAPMLEVSVADGTLQVQLKGNHSNRLYVEQTNIVVNISLPSLVSLKQQGNNSVSVNGIRGQYFKIKTGENGITRLTGSVKELQINSSGNGTVHAEALTAGKVSVHKTGNSNVFVHTDDVFSAQGTGNGNIINTGKAKADKYSGISGNGEIQYTDSSLRKTEQRRPAESTQVRVTMINLSAQRVHLSVIYPLRGSYGIGIPAKDSIEETLPVGTKIFAGNQFTLLKNPLYVVNADNKRQSFTIQ